MAVKKGPQCGQGLPFYQKQNHFVRICSQTSCSADPCFRKSLVFPPPVRGRSAAAQEGSAQVFPKRGIVVSGITVSDIRMIFLRCAPWSSHTRCALRLDNISQHEIERFSQIFHDFETANNCPDFL